MADQPTRAQRGRVVGSGYTVFSYNGSRLMWCQEVSDTPPDPVAPPQVIQPIDEPHPVEIAFPAAAGRGILRVNILEQWDAEVWRRFPGYETGEINDIVDIFRIGQQLGGVTCVKLVQSPPPFKNRSVHYHGAVIVNVDRGELVRIESMVPGKTVEIWYTHVTRKGG